MTSSDVNHLVEEIEQLINAENYREAYKRWQDLRKLVKEGQPVSVDLQDLRVQIESKASLRSQEIMEQLEGLLAVDLNDFEATTAEAELDRLYDVMIDEFDQDYRNYRARVDDRKHDQARRRLYEQTRNEIDNLWKTARKLSQDDTEIAAGVLLDYYTRARDYAERVANENPDNYLLQELVKRAREERERMAGEEEVMTSGGQIGDYRRVLQYINNAPDDEGIMVYDAQNLPMGRKTKEEARAIVIDQAAIYIEGKLNDYLDEAQRLLADHDPRGAQTELERATRLVEIEDLAPGIVPTTQRDILNELQNGVRTALRQLEDAEETARRADIQVERDPLGAWRMLQQSRDSYEGATKHSQVLKDAKLHITEMTVEHLGRQLREAERMIAQFQFVEARELLTRLQDDYAAIDELRTETVIDNIDRALKTAVQRVEDQRSVSEQLTRIRKAAESDSRTALEDLKALEREHPDLTPNDPQYDDVREAVSGAVGADDEYARLEAFLNSTDLQRVRNAADTARSNSDRGARFEKLAGWLDMQTRYLEAEASIRRGNHDGGVTAINSLLSEPDLPETLKTRIQERLLSLQRQRAAMEANNDNLAAARKAIDAMPNDIEKNLREAWNALSRIENFEGTQAVQWESLLRRSFEQMNIRVNFDAPMLRSLLHRLEDVNFTESERWQRRLKVFQTAQGARDNEHAGNSENARLLWENIRTDNQVGGEDILYVTRRINDIEKKQKLADVEDAMQPPEETGEDDLIEWLASLNQLSQELKGLSSQHSDNDIDVLDYAVWAGELDLLYAQYTPASTDKRKALADAATYIRRNVSGRNRKLARSRSRSAESNSDDTEKTIERVKRLSGLAEVAEKLSEAITTVEDDLTANPRVTMSSFAQAYRLWQNAIKTNSTDEQTEVQEFFAPLLRWFEARKTAVIQKLRGRLRDIDAETEGIKSLSPETLPLLGKLAVLLPESEEARRLFDELAGLESDFADQMQVIVGNLVTGQGTGDNGFEVLEAQIKQVVDMQTRLDSVGQIITLFEDMPEGVANRHLPDDLGEVTRGYLTPLKVIENQLGLVRDAADARLRFMKNFRLTEASWEKFSEEIDNDLKEFRRNMAENADRITKALKDYGDTSLQFNEGAFTKNHPVMRYLDAQKEEVIQRFREVRDYLKKMQKLADEERFAEASLLAQQISDETDPRFRVFHNSDLYETFTVRDVWQKRDVTGWDEISKWVKRSHECWLRLEVWSKRYYDDDNTGPVASVVNWENIQDEEIRKIIFDTNTAISTDPFMLITGSDQVQAYIEARRDAGDYTDAVIYQVRLDMAYGQFDQAVRRLETALEGGGALPDDMTSMRAAFDAVSRVPLADQEPEASTDDYDQAINHAGSNKGVARIRWMREHRLDVYRRWINEAETLKKQIRENARKWQQLDKQFHDKLTDLADALEKYERQMLRRGYWRDQVRSAVDEIKDTFKDMERLCPLHPDIPTFRANPLYSSGKNI